MNQILSTNNNYKAPKNRNTELLDMKKIILVFSIIIIIFALVIVGAKAYGIIKEKNKTSDSPITTLNKPSISITEVERTARIVVSYDEGLSKVSYWWNNDTNVQENNQNGGDKPFDKPVPIPDGDYNVLYVKAVGVDGSVSEAKKEFKVEKQEEDPNKPQISWYQNNGTPTMDIIAKSDKGIKELTYQWEGEEKVVVTATQSNQKELSVTIDLKRGTNKIEITATDIEGNEQVKNGTLIGILEPEIKVSLDHNKTLIFDITHDKGFKKIEITVNDKKLVYDENSRQYDKNITNFKSTLDVEPGHIKVYVSVYTLENEEKEYTFKSEIDI